MMNAETLAITLGLGSAMAWGAGDFSGGLASRKGNLLSVVLISQILGGILLALMALLFGDPFPPAIHLLHGALAGVFGIFGLIALYKGLANGRMGIVAPLSAVLAALIPIGYSALYNGLPTITQFIGFGCFIAAIWLLSSADAGFKMTFNELFLSIFSGLGFALFFILIDRANNLAVFWPLVGSRCASVSLLLLIFFVTDRPAKPINGQWIFIGITGVLDAAGNLLFSMASHLGRLDISAALGSLYPAATVLLALIFLKEQLRRQQWVGVAVAFVALVIITV